MHLMFTLDADGKRVYTLKKVVNGEVTKSAHPARFSPDDRYSRYISHHEVYLKRQKEALELDPAHWSSRHRVTIKKRYGLLITQQSMPQLYSHAIPKRSR